MRWEVAFLAIVCIDWRLGGFQQGYSLWAMGREGSFCRGGKEQGREKKNHKDIDPFNVGETSASSAILESIAVRRVAEYFVLLCARG